MKRVFCFDLDGTVVDSMPILRTMGIAIMASAPDINDELAVYTYDSTVGQPFRTQLSALHPSHTIRFGDRQRDQLARLYTQIHEEIAHLFRLTPLGQQIAERPVDPADFFVLVSSTSAQIIKHMRQLDALGFNLVLGLSNGESKMQQIQKAISLYSDHGRDEIESVYVGNDDSDHALAQILGLPFFWHTTPLSQILQWR